MAVDISRLRQLIKEDYVALCEKLKLSSTTTELDIYVINFNSNEKTSHGTLVCENHALYKPGLMILPFTAGDLSSFHDQKPVSQPLAWHPNDRNYYTDWPFWRIELWHETSHKIEDEVLHAFRGGHEHGEPWLRALDEMAARLNVSGVTGAVLMRLLPG